MIIFDVISRMIGTILSEKYRAALLFILVFLFLALAAWQWLSFY